MKKSLMKKISVVVMLAILINVTNITINASGNDKAYLSQADNISGSDSEFYANVEGGSNKLWVKGDNDFKPGQGISIKAAGKEAYKNYWFTSTVVKVEGNDVYIEDGVDQTSYGALVIHDDTEAVNEFISDEDTDYYFDVPVLNVHGLKLTSNSNYIGMNTTLQIPLSYNKVTWVQGMIVMDGTKNITFSDFNVDGGNRYGISNNGITGIALVLATNTKDITIKDNTFKNNDYVALDFQAKNINITISDNNFFDTNVGVLAMPEWKGSLELENINIEDNTFDGGPSEAISLLTELNDNSGYGKDISIISNKISDKSGAAIIYGGKSENVIIRDNDISKTYNGIVSNLENSLSENDLTAADIYIEGNHFSNIKQKHLILNGKDITVESNIFNTGATIIELGKVKAESVDISDNEFIDISVGPDNVVSLLNVSDFTHSYNIFNGFSETSEPVIEEPVIEEPVIEEPVIEEPVIEEPVIEEPVIEEPVIEEPVIEEPVIEEPVIEEPVIKEPVIEEPVMEEPVIEEPVIKEPVIEEPVIEEPVIEEKELEDGQIYLSKFDSISASTLEFSGSVNSGSNVLTLSQGHDFKAGQGIAIQNASSKDYLNYWLTTTIEKVEGNKIYLSENASKNAYNQKVIHDDTSALNDILKEGNNTFHFDVEKMNVKGVMLQSNSKYIGEDVVLNLPVSYSAVKWVQGMILATNITNIDIQGFTIDGGKTRGVYGDDQVGVALFLALDSSNINISNNNFVNNFYIGVDFQGTIKNVTVEDNNILNTDVGILAMPEWQGILELENAIFQRNIIDGGTSEGISIESGMYSNTGSAHKIRIYDNVINDKVATGIQYGGRTTDLKIEGNKISYTNSGITTRDENLETVANMTTNDITINNNIIENVKWNHMIIDGTNTVINNNTFTNGSAFILLGRGKVDGIEITDNTFYGAQTSEPIIKLNVTNITESNNQIK